MKRILSCMVILCIAGISCSKEAILSSLTDQPPASEITEFLIRKGNHYSDQNGIQILNTSSITASVTFDSSAIYSTVDPSNQADINKLLGFSDCGTEHQVNSARLGWSWNGNAVVIYAYAYVNKERISRPLGPVALNKAFDCFVKADKGFYIFKAGEYIDSIPRYCNSHTGSRYKLYPYFGGDETAPHDMKIVIQ